MQIKNQRWHHVTIAVAMAVSVLPGPSSLAQGPDRGFPPPGGQGESFRNQKITPDEIAEKESKWMKKKLKLNKDQLQKVKAINSVYAFKRQDYLSAMGPGKEGSRKKMMERLVTLDREKDEELRKVFSQKQYDLYVKKKVELDQQVRSAEGSDSNLSPPPPPDGNFE